MFGAEKLKIMGFYTLVLSCLVIPNAVSSSSLDLKTGAKFIERAT